MNKKTTQSLHVSLCILPIALAVFTLFSAGMVSGAINERDERGGGIRSVFLILDGVKCGYLASLEGGYGAAEVVSEPPGPTYIVKKHIGQVKYEPFTAEIGFSAAKPVFDWIRNTWARTYVRHNGAVIPVKANVQPDSETQFSNALLAETTIPACDASKREASFIKISFAPESTQSAAAEDINAQNSPITEQKGWSCQDFSLTIDGLDCTKVIKIDSFTVKQKITTDNIGDARAIQNEPAKLEFPHLKIVMSESAAQGWYDWFKSFAIEGNNGESNEKNGTLTFYAPNMKDELVRIVFHNLGICKIVPDKYESNSEEIRHVTVDLYCETMEFKYNAKVTGKRNTELQIR